MLMIITFTLNSIFNLVIGLMVAKFLGPADFGRYALAQSIGIVFNTVFIDWLRHSVTRFYKGDDENSVSVRATLELTLGISCILICLISGIGILAGVDFGLGLSLALMAPLIGITNGLFDFTTAMLRAEFRNRPYGQAIIIKNLLSITLIIGAAYFYQNPATALAGLCLSILTSLASIWKYIRHPVPSVTQASFKHLKTFAAYALPIMFANVLIQAIPLFNRTLISQKIGFDATGQYSLAYDFGTRIMAGVGSALDILLLQLAIKADHDFGREAAKQRLSQNLTIILAVMLPLCVGLWLVLPSFAQVFVPQAFRAEFMAIFEALLPGFFAYAMLFFALHQVFFLSEKTWPLVVAAGLALVINITGVSLLRNYNPVAIAHMQSLGMIAALVAGCCFAFKMLPVKLNLKDIAATLLAVALMTGITYSARGWAQGLATLLMTASLGGAVYVLVMIVTDTAGLRTKIMSLKRQAKG